VTEEQIFHRRIARTIIAAFEAAKTDETTWGELTEQEAQVMVGVKEILLRPAQGIPANPSGALFMAITLSFVFDPAAEAFVNAPAVGPVQ